MNLRYYLFDPTKNVTALSPSPVAPEARPAAAMKIMQKEPACEQVGFVYRGENGDPCLAMAGGEFCGNASMSAAAMFCKEKGIAPGDTQTIRLRVSGTNTPVEVRVTMENKECFLCTVSMPEPERISEEQLPQNGTSVSLPVVFFPGIAHIIPPEGLLTPLQAEKMIKQWCAALGVKGLGLMLPMKDPFSIRPLVYIPEADTLFWESSCASGTTALGAYHAREEGKSLDQDVRQPGGMLHIAASPDGELLLTGATALIKEGNLQFVAP